MTATEWFIAERCRAMAVVYLTRRDDLKFVNPSEEAKKQGIDILVHLDKPSSPLQRQLGVALDASLPPTTPARLNKALKPRMHSFLQDMDSDYPVCLFYFTMQDNGSYYTWVVEPVVTEKEQPRLLRREQAHCKPLDREALDTIIEHVHRWYDAL